MFSFQAVLESVDIQIESFLEFSKIKQSECRFEVHIFDGLFDT